MRAEVLRQKAEFQARIKRQKEEAERTRKQRRREAAAKVEAARIEARAEEAKRQAQREDAARQNQEEVTRRVLRIHGAVSTHLVDGGTGWRTGEEGQADESHGSHYARDEPEHESTRPQSALVSASSYSAAPYTSRPPPPAQLVSLGQAVAPACGGGLPSLPTSGSIRFGPLNAASVSRAFHELTLQPRPKTSNPKSRERWTMPDSLRRGGAGGILDDSIGQLSLFRAELAAQTTQAIRAARASVGLPPEAVQMPPPIITRKPLDLETLTSTRRPSIPSSASSRSPRTRLVFNISDAAAAAATSPTAASPEHTRTGGVDVSERERPRQLQASHAGSNRRAPPLPLPPRRVGLDADELAEADHELRKAIADAEQALQAAAKVHTPLRDFATLEPLRDALDAALNARVSPRLALAHGADQQLIDDGKKVLEVIEGARRRHQLEVEGAEAMLHAALLASIGADSEEYLKMAMPHARSLQPFIAKDLFEKATRRLQQLTGNAMKTMRAARAFGGL